ncbi:hypothetical protein DEU56DRAFT_752262 [Suillus clintonianus]|uniref:uncharacterized protein n=1 Tax=Suillus clintonianus TaxID=1904413 RepID=UPI001B884929|nr:uncharacterized protein DEU56DRAFT_752262 [Suillus clintonianus]KAG2151329.1 hypothetical protein DEU56DRAFT_752262 [Suillus clintonianus]
MTSALPAPNCRIQPRVACAHTRIICACWTGLGIIVILICVSIKAAAGHYLQYAMSVLILLRARAMLIVAHSSQAISTPRPQQHSGRFKKLRLAMTRSPHPVSPPPVPTPAPPTAPPLAATPMTFTAHVRHLFTWRLDHAAPPIVEVPFAGGDSASLIRFI